MSKQKSDQIHVFALGGVGEIGKNMYVVEVNGNIFILDAGLMFPEDEMFGVDLVIPDITYLTENKSRVKAIFLTHGHEDHIGALAYVLQKINVPVYGTKLTLGLAGELLKEANFNHRHDFRLIDPDMTVEIDDTLITFFRVNHSIPDAVGICIHTSQGAVVYTGDFKFDQTPVDQKHTEIAKLAALGESGVLCLLSDSVNAENPGFTPSESMVGQRIFKVIAESSGKVIIATFASNIHRIQQVFTAVESCKRKVAIAGKNLLKIVEMAQDLGYLHIVEDVVIDLKDLKNYDDHDVVILTTGNRGEPLAALSRMATNLDRHVQIKQGDTVIIAATPPPGNEKLLAKTVDALYRAGADVVSGKNGIHVSGHASQDELKLMINLLKPRYLLPIHGEYRMQKAHQDLAVACGMDKKDVYLLQQGEVVEFSHGYAKGSGKVPSGKVLIDGLGVGDVGNIVLRDRRLLSQDGILIVVVTMDRKKFEIVSGPEIISRGFVYVRESEPLLKEAQENVSDALHRCMNKKINEWTELKSVIRDSLSHLLYDKTKRRPMIMPIIMEI